MESKPKIGIRLVKDAGELKAFADVTLRVKFGEITVLRFKVLQGEEKPWVAFPQLQYLSGLSTKYVSLLRMNKRVEQYLSNLILQECGKASNKHPKISSQASHLAELPTLIQEGVR